MRLPIFSIKESVFLTHFALQFGEFGDHAGREVRLGEEGSAVGVSGFLCREVPVLADGFRQFLKAVCFITHVAHAFLIVDAGEVVSVAFQGLLAVVFEEEFRIVKTGTEDFFVAVLNVFEGFRSAVTNSQEVRHERAVFVSDRVVSLMVTHRGNNGWYRELQEFIIDPAIERSRVFDEVVDLFQEVCIVPDVAAELVCNGEKAGANHFAAFILINDDKGFPHGLLVGERIRDHDRFLAEETVTAADIATLDVSKFHRDDLLVAESDDPADRTDEMGFFIGPTHASGEVQAGDEGEEELGKDVFDFLARMYDMRPGVFPFFDEFRWIDVLAAGKSLGSACRISISIESSFDGWAAFLDFFIRLAVCGILDEDGETARGRVNGDAFGSEAVGFELGSRECFQLVYDTGHDIGRHFLCTDF